MPISNPAPAAALIATHAALPTVHQNAPGLLATHAAFANVHHAPPIIPVSIVLKTSDEIVNNSIVLQDDDELLVAVEANKSYFIEAVLICYQESGSADYKFKFTVPTAATAWWDIEGMAYHHTNTSQSDQSEGDTLTKDLDGVEHQIVILRGIFMIAGNAGNVTLQWAQSSAVADDSKILKESFLRITELG